MSWFLELRNRFSHLRGRHRFEESLDEEMRLHIESRVEELIAAGRTRAAALAEARREFGQPARLAEESREAWRWGWLEDLGRDVRYAARSLGRDRGLAATAVISLALGIGVNTTIFSLTAEFLFSRPSVRDPDTLVHAQIGGASHIPMREYRFIRDAGVFQSLAGADVMQEANWRTGDSTHRLFVTRATGNFFEVTGIPLAFGRAFQTGEREVVVISHGFWQNRLTADPGVLGRGLILDGRPHTIVGVLPAAHRTVTGFGYSPDLYVPVARENTAVSFYGRLPEGVSRRDMVGRLRTAAAELDRVYPDGNHKWVDEVLVMNLAGIERLGEGFLTTITAFFAMLMAVVGLLLVIACANVASLLLARASARVHEFAIRRSIGADRGRLMRQLLAESLLLSVLGTAVGLALNYALTRTLNGAALPMPFPLRLSIETDARLLIYAAAVAVGSALLAGLLPAIRATRPGASELLKRDERQVRGRRATLRNMLVAGQLAVSALVLIMAALSIRNLIRSASLDPGFDIRNTLWAQVRLVPGDYATRGKVLAQVSATLDRVRGLPGVESATAASVVPLNDHFLSRTETFYPDSAARGVRVEYSWNAIGPDYFRTMGIGVVAGREFSTLDREGSAPAVIINESFARRVFGGVNPVGQRLRYGRDDRTGPIVVGVVRNSKYSAIGERDRAALYEAYFQVAGRRTALQFLVKYGGPPERLRMPLNAALLEAEPAAAVEVKLMSQSTGFALLPSRAGALALGSIGALGLALAAVGLYGVLA
ncbi:MAG: ABC transporter permease, partial [Bryobacteraceae bacterium]